MEIPTAPTQQPTPMRPRPHAFTTAREITGEGLVPTPTTRTQFLILTVDTGALIRPIASTIHTGRAALTVKTAQIILMVPAGVFLVSD